MKTTITLSVFTLMLMSVFSQNSHAQSRSPWETGDLTSRVTQAEVESIRGLPRNPKSDIEQALKDVKTISDPSEARDMLLKQAKRIVEYSKAQGDKLLLSQSLASGITLTSYIQDTVIDAHKAPAGTVRQQVRILKHAFTQAKKYFERDRDYMNRLINTPQADARSSDWVYFGKELSKFIMELSEGMLNMKAHYAINRWAAGVFERKLLDDRNRAAFKTAFEHLHDRVESLPNPIGEGYHALDTNDIQYAEMSRKVKLAMNNAIEDSEDELKDLESTFNKQ